MGKLTVTIDKLFDGRLNGKWLEFRGLKWKNCKFKELKWKMVKVREWILHFDLIIIIIISETKSHHISN